MYPDSNCPFYDPAYNDTPFRKGKVTQNKAPFSVGDLVKLKTGTSTIRVTGTTRSLLTGQWSLRGTYVSSKHEFGYRKQEDFEVISEGKDPMTLYQFTVDNVTKYGTYLATNSSGMFVMEEKGTGSILTVDKDTVEEVLPYTIGVKFLSSQVTYSYFAKPETFKVGEVYLLEAPGGLCFVSITELNTKSKAATKDFKPLSKIQMVPVDNN